MMRTPEKDFALLYFENQSVLPELNGFVPDTSYLLQWFSPAKGEWHEPFIIQTDKTGKLVVPFFPDRQNPAVIDWAAKITEKQ